MLDGVDIYDFSRYYSHRTNILKRHRQKKKKRKQEVVFMKKMEKCYVRRPGKVSGETEQVLSTELQGSANEIFAGRDFHGQIKTQENVG